MARRSANGPSSLTPGTDGAGRLQACADEGEQRDAVVGRNERLSRTRSGSGASIRRSCPASEMLRFYAERFTTVEINNTFYRMPAESMLAQWLQQVPDQFTFTLKAPKRITHDQRLRESESNVAEFLRRADILGSKLGVILFQLPPYLKKDVPRLKEFLDLLPSGKRIAFEFRSTIMARRRGLRAAAQPRRDSLRNRHRRRRHAVHRDFGLRLHTLASNPLRRRRPARVDRADRREGAAADLRLFHARRRSAGNQVRATAQRTVGGTLSKRWRLRRRAPMARAPSCARLAFVRGNTPRLSAR